MTSVRGSDKGPGRFRTIQNFIGKPGSSINDATFIPPSPLHLQQHLNEWEKYWHAEAPDPLVQLAVIHAQFEIIHPFLDGNGRIGRMIIPLFLFEKEILKAPSFYLSEYFEKKRDDYIDKLRDIRSPGSWTRWCKFFLEGVEKQAGENTRKAREILDLYHHLKSELPQLIHSQYSIPLLDYIFEKPIFKASEIHKRENMPTAPAVNMMLNKMKSKGILTTVVEGAGRKSQILAFPELVNISEGKKVL